VSYETDDEKVEAIKAWWKENGVAIVMGVAIGLGAIVGWRYWGDYRDSVAGQARPSSIRCSRTPRPVKPRRS
jgi:predicted negative regulator of RcsB-dependent stress response